MEQATWLIPKSEAGLWNPGADTLDQGGAYTEQNAAETDYAEPENWEEYNVTEIIKYFLDHPDENFGFLLISDEEMNNTQRAYASSDFTDDTSQRPKLTIETETAISWFPQAGLKDRINLHMTNTTMRFSLPFDNCLVRISNARGQKFVSFEGTYGNSHTIPLSKLGAGVHFLTVKHDNKSATVKFFVIK